MGDGGGRRAEEGEGEEWMEEGSREGQGVEGGRREGMGGKRVF